MIILWVSWSSVRDCSSWKKNPGRESSQSNQILHLYEGHVNPFTLNPCFLQPQAYDSPSVSRLLQTGHTATTFFGIIGLINAASLILSAKLILVIARVKFALEAPRENDLCWEQQLLKTPSDHLAIVTLGCYHEVWHFLCRSLSSRLQRIFQGARGILRWIEQSYLHELDTKLKPWVENFDILIHVPNPAIPIL